MAAISAQTVKELREKTGVGMMDCKQALAACNGDMEKSVEFLRKKGLATAEKRAGRAISQGTIQSYIHMGGKIGVLLELGCETDFVAKNEDFQELARSLAMHVAAASPLGVSENDVDPDVIAKERAVYEGQALEEGKKPEFVGKIVEGRVAKFLKENCLLNQPYVKNPDITIADLINDTIAKIGENITIKRFTRYQIGE
jgi:elongation factor Ts